MARYVLGIELAPERLAAVLVDRYGNLQGHAEFWPEAGGATGAGSGAETGPGGQPAGTHGGSPGVPGDAPGVDPEHGVAAMPRLLERLWAETGAGPDAVRYAVLVADLTTPMLAARRRLAPVAAIRLAVPAGTAVPPLADWPPDLRAAVGSAAWELTGGFELDGRPIGPLPSEAEVTALIRAIQDRGLQAAAITGIFAPVHPQHELWLAAALREGLEPEFPLTLSHTLGGLGLLERENATALNAALIPHAAGLIRRMAAVLAAAGVNGPAYLARSDGTLLSLQAAARFPLLTARAHVGHGLRGAAHLAALWDCAVVLGGTGGVEVGLVQEGAPRETTRPASLAGIRVALPRPATISVPARDPDGTPLGPGMWDRVGRALQRLQGRPAPIPVVLAGPEPKALPAYLSWTHRIVRPTEADYVAPVGAALAPVGAWVDLLYPLDRWTEEGARADAIKQAVERAAAAGADPNTVVALHLEALPQTYVAENVLRIRVKVSGRPVEPAAVSARMSL